MRVSAPPAEAAFALHAARLAGLAGALLGWRPAEFWAATPAELEQILRVLAGPEAGAAPPTPATIASLKERFPDG
ncbi:MAG TPA: phage tail assembly chaperone [Sphingomonas sp.]